MSENKPLSEHSYSVGDRVRGHDPDYDENYEGDVVEIRETRDGSSFLIVANELPGAFERAHVGLAAHLWQRCSS